MAARAWRAPREWLERPAVANALVTSASGAYWKTATWTEGTGTATVTVNAAKTFQTWDGFGGAFNEMGWSFLSTKALQDQAIQMLFGVEGCHFAWGRIPIGASDYAMDRYTLNENAGDNEMTKFSIERDKQKLIPYIKAAQAVRPDLRFWASPWTPPSWMKSSPYQTPGNPVNAFDGGTMKSDDATMKAHALYFVKFIKAYSEQGIKVDYVAPQNEPNYSQNYPSAIWSASTFTTFIGKYLGPALASANPTAQIMLGTMSNRQRRRRRGECRLGAMRPPRASAKVMGVQWGMSDSDQVSNLQSKGAGIPIWLSEHKCGGNPGANVAAAPNDLSYAEGELGLDSRRHQAWPDRLQHLEHGARQGRQRHRQHPSLGAKRAARRGRRANRPNARVPCVPSLLAVRRAAGEAHRRDGWRCRGVQEPRRQPGCDHVQQRRSQQ